MPDTRIRRARPGDEEVIVKNNRAMAKETENKDLDPETARAGVLEALQNDRRGFYLLAEHDGRVVGQALITYEWSDWRNSDFWWIQSVYVNPQERKAGIFRRLFGHILSQAERNPKVCGLRLYVHRDNRRAQSAYLSLGMNHAHYEMFEVEL